MDWPGNDAGAYGDGSSERAGEADREHRGERVRAVNTIPLADEAATRSRLSECLRDPDREIIDVSGSPFGCTPAVSLGLRERR